MVNKKLTVKMQMLLKVLPLENYLQLGPLFQNLKMKKKKFKIF